MGNYISAFGQRPVDEIFMIDIKVNCSCGQRYVFSVEPVGGQMPNTVQCPVCGKDGTKAANEQIAQAAIFQPAAKQPAQRMKTGKVPLVISVVSILVSLLVSGGVYYWYNRGEEPSLANKINANQSNLSKPAAKPKRIRKPGDPYYPPDAKTVGVGLFVYKDHAIKKFMVGHVIPNSPAAKAGIQAKDILHKIDDQVVDNYPLQKAADHLRGPIGDSVSVEIINHATGETNQFQLVRALF